MPSPLAFLAGFGQGAAGLGQDMETQAALQEAQRSRRATDALTRLATMVKLGAQPVMPGTDPTQALQALQNRNTQQAGLVNAPGAGAFSGGIDPSQFGQPQIANLPTAAGGQDSFILDPSRTPEALAELRAGRAEDARYRQATDVERQHADAMRAEKDQERHTADVRTAAAAFGDAQALQSLVAKNPKSPYASLLKNLPDPSDTNHWISLAPSLDKAFKDESARQLQASEYHATPAMWTQTGDVDKATGEPIFVNTASPTLERRTLSGAMPKPTGGGGGMNSGAQTSLPDLLRSHLALKEDENDPNFQPSFSQQLREGMNYGLRQDQVKGTVPPVSQALLGTALNSFVSGDPRQIGYMQNGRSWGEDASNAWKGRTNEERVIRDVNTGTLNSSNTGMPNVRSQVQERRENVIAMTAIANPQQFNSLDPQSKAVIQTYITRLPPDKRVVAEAAARQAAASGAISPSGGTGNVDLSDVAAYLKNHPSRTP